MRPPRPTIALYLLSFLLSSLALHRPTFAIKKVSIQSYFFPLKKSRKKEVAPIAMPTVMIFLFIFFSLCTYLLACFYCCIGVVICGVLGITFASPKLIRTWTKPSDRESLWVSWVLLGQVLKHILAPTTKIHKHHLSEIICLNLSAKCSREVAKESIFYSYTRHINGFAATLEEEEAAQIASENLFFIFFIFFLLCFVYLFFSCLPLKPCRASKGSLHFLEPGKKITHN